MTEIEIEKRALYEKGVAATDYRSLVRRHFCNKARICNDSGKDRCLQRYQDHLKGFCLISWVPWIKHKRKSDFGPDNAYFV